MVTARLNWMFPGWGLISPAKTSGSLTETIDKPASVLVPLVWLVVGTEAPKWVSGCCEAGLVYLGSQGSRFLCPTAPSAPPLSLPHRFPRTP